MRRAPRFLGPSTTTQPASVRRRERRPVLEPAMDGGSDLEARAGNRAVGGLRDIARKRKTDNGETEGAPAPTHRGAKEAPLGASKVPVPPDNLAAPRACRVSGAARSGRATNRRMPRPAPAPGLPPSGPAAGPRVALLVTGTAACLFVMLSGRGLLGV